MTLLLWILPLLPVPIGAAYTRIAADAFKVAPNSWYCASVNDWVPNCTVPDCCGPSSYDPERLNDDSASTFWCPPDSYPSLSVWIQTPPATATLFYMVAYISGLSGANISVGTAPSMGGECTNFIVDVSSVGAISQLYEFPGPVTSGIWCVEFTPLEPSQVNLYALGVGFPVSTPTGQYWDGAANQPCPGGFFCQDGAAHPCPMDAFCVRGAAVPVPCPPLSTAPMYSNESEACECGDGYYMQQTT
jgi:hypothetical protein